MVEDIERIHTELGVDVLADRSVLQRGEIGIEVPRASVAVALSIAEGIEVGPGERSSSRAVGAKSRVGHEVRPRVGCIVERSETRGHRTDRLVGLAGSVRYVRSALAIARTEEETARPVQRRAKLVSADQEIRPGWNAAQKLLVAAERQIVVPIKLELLLTQIVISSVHHLSVDLVVIVVPVVERPLPRIPCGKLQTLGEALIYCGLQGVVMTVEPVVIVRQALGPAVLGVVVPEIVGVTGQGLPSCRERG